MPVHTLFGLEKILKVIFATSELAPLIKTGGLADVSGSLPGAFARLGLDVQVLLPAYPAVLRGLAVDPASATPVATVPALARLPEAQLLAARGAQGLKLLLVHCPALFDRPGNPYLGPDGKDWPDNDLRFGLLSRIAALLGTEKSPLAWRPDVIHCNDWQAALAPVYLAYGLGQHAASVVTVHNLAYQGIFPADAVARLGLPPESGAEFYGKLSFLKGGLACADAITTVSPTYAQEICTEALGFGLHGLLSRRANVLTGILNGIDTEYWNPAADPLIVQHYDVHTLRNKSINKRALQAAMSLAIEDAVPVLGVVSRLVEQKGIDLVAEIVAELIALPAQLVIQGIGDQDIEERLLALAKKYPRQVAVRVAFDEGLAHMIEAGADLFLMPSRFEPCGMNQMYSQRYGTLPIVCRTGGLADSVVDWTPATLAAGTATGFCFATPSAKDLLGTIRRATDLFRHATIWSTLQRNAMTRDFGWERSAAQYVEVYRRVLRGARH
ncbi:glycogen synthase [Burkholderiales bacterium]|nr:glycogen synthase [Burkholderiales bacterium]